VSEKSSASSGGIGVLGLLGVAFVILKLCGVIDWPWWLVTLPFWGGFAVVIVILILFFFGIALKEARAQSRR
jgi:hypothetical protein